MTQPFFLQARVAVTAHHTGDGGIVTRYRVDSRPGERGTYYLLVALLLSFTGSSSAQNVPPAQSHGHLSPVVLRVMASTNATAEAPGRSNTLPDAPSTSRPAPKVVDAKFLFLAGASVAAMTADYETTHGCIARNACHELNPFFGSNPSRARMYAIGAATTAGTIYAAYYLKKKRKRYWWVPLAAGAGLHGYLAYRNSQF